jgi:hypothetical protein
MARKVIMVAIKTLDQVNLIFCLLIAAASVSRQLEDFNFTSFLSIRLKLSNFLIFLLLAFVWHTLLNLFDLYHSRRFESWKTDIIDVMHATTVCTLVLFIMTWIFHIVLAQPLYRVAI